MHHQRQASVIPALYVGLCLLLPSLGCQQEASVVLGFADSLARKDMTAAISALAPTATLELEGMTFTGPGEMRGALEMLSAQSLPEEVKRSLVVQEGRVSWPQKYSTAEYDALGVTPVEAQVQATLKSGKIVSLNWALTPEMVGKIQAARAAQVTKALSSLEAALNAHNADATLALLHEGAKVDWLGHAVNGKEQLTGWLTDLAKESAMIERVDEPNIKDNSAIWRARVTTAELSNLKLAPVDATATLETSDGKITRFTMVPSPDVVARLKSGAVEGSQHHIE